MIYTQRIFRVNREDLTDCFHLFRPGGNFHRGFHEWQFIRGNSFDSFRSGTLRPELCDFNWCSRMYEEGEYTGTEILRPEYALNCSSIGYTDDGSRPAMGK